MADHLTAPRPVYEPSNDRPTFYDPTDGHGIDNDPGGDGPIIPPIITDAPGALIGLLGGAANAAAGIISILGILGASALSWAHDKLPPTDTGAAGGSCDAINRNAVLDYIGAYADTIAEAHNRGSDSKRNQTVAILAVCDIDTGKLKFYVGTRGEDLTPEQQEAAEYIDPDALINVAGFGPHAEREVVGRAKNDAKTDPVQPIAIYVTNPFCGTSKENCLDWIESEGAEVVPPNPPKRKSRGGKWEPPVELWGPSTT